MQMMKSKRFPIPEQLLNVPDDWDFFIDSLTAAAYNSEEIEAYSKLLPEVLVPQNSLESLEEIDFKSSSEDSVDMIPKPQTRKEKQEVKKRPEKLKKDAVNLHGFDMN